MYCTPIWKIRKVVYKAQVADTVINKQAIDIKHLEGALKASDSSAAAAREARDAVIEKGAELENQVKLQEQKATYWERLSKTWKRISIGASAVIIIELVAIVAQAVGD